MKFSETLHSNHNVLFHPFIQDGEREKKLIQESGRHTLTQKETLRVFSAILTKNGTNF